MDLDSKIKMKLQQNILSKKGDVKVNLSKTQIGGTPRKLVLRPVTPLNKVEEVPELKKKMDVEENSGKASKWEIYFQK